MLNLDTHILIKFVDGTLTHLERNILTGDAEWGVSAIVLWEIEKLHSAGRLRYGLDDAVLAAAVSRLYIWPITGEICLNLRSLDLRSDPADELIAATSFTHQVPLVTRDARIRASKIVRCL